MKYPTTMEAGGKSDQGYESYDSLSACGSERKSSLSDAEFEPISDEEDDDEDDYSKPALDDGVIDELSEQLRDGATLLSRAPMKNIENVRELRREHAQPWSVQTQNSVSPSGGRVIRTADTNTSYLLQNYERVYSGQLQAQNIHSSQYEAQNIHSSQYEAQNIRSSQYEAQNIRSSQYEAHNVLTSQLQAQNIISRPLQPQNIITTVHQRNDLNNLASNNFLSKNLTTNNPASNNFLSKNLTTNNDYQTAHSGVDKILPSYEAPTTTTAAANNLINIYVQPPSVSPEALPAELDDLSDYPELQEFARFRAEEENSTGSDYTEYIRHLFTDTLPELSAADVKEGFGQLDKNDFGKFSPLSFSSTIVPPSVDSYPSSPTDCDLLAALADQDALGASLSAAQSNESTVPDFMSILRTAETGAKQDPPTTTSYSSLVSSSTDYATSFLDIRGQRGSFSTSSTPSHPGSVEYSPQSSADSQPSPHSSSGADLELYQQFSPNIIPVTVNDDLGEDDGSRLDHRTAKERLLQRIRADAALKKAKDAAWLAASKTEPEKLIIVMQDLCRAVDHSVEAKFYANMEVFVDNASQEQVVQLFESVRFQRCANVVNNPLLSAYVCEIMLERGVE